MNQHQDAPSDATVPSSVLADLHFDDVVVESIHVRTVLDRAAQDGDEAVVPVVEVSVDVLRAGDEPRFMVPMAVKVNRHKGDLARFGYSFEVEALGFFSFDEGTDEHHIGHLIGLNAPAMLYGVIRGIAAQALALTAVGRVVLPSANFVEIMRQRQERLRRRRQRSARSRSEEHDRRA